MKISILAGALAIILTMAACSPSQSATVEVEATVPAATMPAATAVATEPIPTPEPVATEAAPTEVTPTEIPPTEIPEVDEMTAFIEQLETAVTSQDYVQMQALMSDPIGIGAWRSEWRMYDPAQTIEGFESGSLPAPAAVQFSDLDDAAITALLGQPPSSMLGPTVNVAAALHSTGWGPSSGDEAILFVVEEDGRFAWDAFLYTDGSFAGADVTNVAPPVGLIVRVPENGIYQIQASGEPRQLLDEESATIPDLQLSPDGRHAAYLDDQRQLWLIDTATNDQRQLASDFNLSYFLMWGDNSTLFVGVWLDPNEADGPNNGHISTLDIESGDLIILDENNLSGNRPALLSNGDMVAFDVFSSATSGRLYDPVNGPHNFDPKTFTAGNEMIQGNLFNPAWASDGSSIAWIANVGDRFAVQRFDLETFGALQLHDWDPARFGGMVPSPVYSPDNQWLAIEVLANGPEGSGLWLLAADGSSQTLVDALGHQPYWVNDFQLVFNRGFEPRLYDVSSGEQFGLDLPSNSSVVGMAALDAPEAFPVADTPVEYILALQDVPMFSGPGEEYMEIGGIFDGQTGLVTGQSLDGRWWRVICPDDTVGDCWVTADPAYTSVADN